MSQKTVQDSKELTKSQKEQKALEDPEEQLARFREEWRAEVRRRRDGQEALKRTQEQGPSSDAAEAKAPDVPATHPLQRPTYVVAAVRENSIDPASLPPSAVKALAIYERAIACERRSEIDEALRLYRLAFRIDDKVGRIHEELEYSRFRQHGAVKPTALIDAVPEHAHVSAEAAVEHITQGVASVAVAPSGKHANLADALDELVSGWPIDIWFDPEDEKEAVHIRRLPDELFAKVMGYLDVTSLERFALVNRKARALALDATVWLRHVNHVYRGPQIPEDETILSLCKKYKGDPRRVYIEHPRVRMDGVYIAVCHYIRPGLGESPWINVSHLVTYHRYLRFYPTGQVLSLLTNEHETPQQAIPRLQLTSQEKSLYIGAWRLEGTTMYITDLLEVLGDTPRYMFQMTLELRSRPLGRWNRLSFKAYETVAIADGEVSSLPLKNERPYWFSKVRSYT